MLEESRVRIHVFRKIAATRLYGATNEYAEGFLAHKRSKNVNLNLKKNRNPLQDPCEK